MILMQSKLDNLGLQVIRVEVGGAGDCFFRSVSHQLYGNNNHHMEVQYMRDHPERFVESNTENSWLRYLKDSCIQCTWADVLVIQAVADALNVSIQIANPMQAFHQLLLLIWLRKEIACPQLP